MSDYYIRVNGVGNAWPVLLGTHHPFYDPEVQGQLANASFSILKTTGGNPSSLSIEREILIDAGNGIAQFLIRHGNRLPDAIVITHSHLDHTLSLDWIIQSRYRLSHKKRKMVLYATLRSWEAISATFPQLPPLTDYRDLNPGLDHSMAEIPELKLRSLPVYHGDMATGPAMLVFELSLEGKDPVKMIFSGDLLCPLLRKADYRYLQNAAFAFLDSNNRFPYTNSNHWSLCSEGPAGGGESPYLRSYRQDLSCTRLIAAHIRGSEDPSVHAYFDEFLAYCHDDLPFSVFDFCSRIKPEKVGLVHYSGMEDRNHYQEDILNPVQLENWSMAEAERRGLPCEFFIPLPGDVYKIS
jgi:hypothetical protein